MDTLVSNTRKFDLSSALGVVCYILFIHPQQYAIGLSAFRFYQVGICVVTAVSLIAFAAKGRITRRWLLFVLFYISFYLLSSTVSQSNESIVSYTYSAVKGIGFITVTELLLQKDKCSMLKSFCIASGLMCVLHLGTVFYYFDTVGGMRHGYIPSLYGSTVATDQNWYLLTYDNESIFYFIPAFCAMLIYSLYYNKKYILLTIVFIVITLFTFVAKEAATATASTICFLLMLAFGLIARNKRINLFFIACVLGVAISVVAVVAIGSGFMTDVAHFFGRGASFSGRNLIWERSIEWFLETPVFGQGIDQTATTYLRLGQTHCHNILLEILYSGGIISLTFFLLGIVFSTPRTKVNGTAGIVLAAGVLSFFLAACMDWYPSIPIPFVMFLMAKSFYGMAPAALERSSQTLPAKAKPRLGLYKR